jgi:hypothetical protein
MPVQWDEFEAVDSPEASVAWDDFEPAENPRDVKRQQLRAEQAALTKEQEAQERRARFIDPLMSGAEGALTALSLSPSAIAKNLEAGIPATAAAVRGEETFEPLKPVVSGFLNPEAAGEENLLKTPKIPGGDDWYTQIPAGLGNAVLSLVDVMTTPEGILTLGIGGLPKAAQKQVVGLIGANMAAHYPAEFDAAVEAVKRGDLTTATEKFITSPVMASVMGRASIDMPPAVKPVPEFPGLPDPDLVARNVSSPGTLRPQERAAVSPPGPRPPNEIFEAGEVPFNRMQRFAEAELPPVEIIERTKPPETRPIVERETRGKVSFGAEAPTLLRTAIEGEPPAPQPARRTFGFDEPQNPMVTVYQGQEGGSGGGAYWTTNPARARSFGGNVQAVEIPQAVFEAGQKARQAAGSGTEGDILLPNDWANKAKAVEVPETVIDLTAAAPEPPAPATPAAFVEQVKTTDAAWEYGFQRRTPEGIAELEQLKTGIDARREAIKADESLTPEQRLSQREALAKESQLVNEALSMAKGETASPLANEWLKNKTAAAVTAPGDALIASVEQMTPGRAAKLNQRKVPKGGWKLTPADVPKLERARDAAMQRMEAAGEADPVAFKAEYGKNIYFSWLIEVANRRGPNFDQWVKDNGSPPARPGQSVRELAKEFDRVILEVGAELGWLDDYPLLQGTIDTTRSGHGTASLKAKMEQHRQLQKLRRFASSQISSSGKDATKELDRADLLPRLQEWVEEQKRKNPPKEPAKPIEAERVPSEDMPEVTPEQAKKFLDDRDREINGSGPDGGNLNILEQADAKLAEIQAKMRKGSFTGVFGVEPVIADAAISAARLALKATNSMAKAIAAAIDYIRKNHPDLKFDSDKFRSSVAMELSKPASPASTAPAPRAPAASGAAPAPAPGTPAPGPAPAPGTPPAPPAPPRRPAPPTPAPGPGGRPAPAGTTLDDVYRVFEPAPKPGKSIRQRVSKASEAFRTGLSSSFRPLNKLAEDIARSYGGGKKDVAGIFEQLKGSSGKAEADVYRFDQEVTKKVGRNQRDFNAYVFLRRTLDRLQQDAADIAKAIAVPGSVPKLNRRAVSKYTIPEIEAKLKLLESKLSPEQLKTFQDSADSFQKHMDLALKLQVDSGRMSVEMYNAIKAGNSFYAPFKVMKYLEESIKPEGSGRRIDTTAKLTKAMEGIEDADFNLGDMMAAARQNITMSRILAEKNRAMQNISDLAVMDTGGLFVKPVKVGTTVPHGMEMVKVFEGGKERHYAVAPEIAQAVQMAGNQSGYLVARMASGMFRLGATTLNLPFQVSNLLADVPRAAFISKYGFRSPADLIVYPIDLIHAAYSSMAGNVFGKKTQLFLDFLDSGAAGTTVQRYLTPDALEFKPSNGLMTAGDAAKSVLTSPARFAEAVEQTSKILGVKRAMRAENIGTGKSLARFAPEAITEIRRFSGSPDFGRMGKWVDQYRLNLMYMFLNARIQGTIADAGRLAGRDGAGTAAKTWAKIGIPVGLATIYNYIVNSGDEFKEDYAKRPEQEKRNYWLIPKDKYITGADGEKVRDYWRVPKREVSKWIANMVEAGMDFAKDRDPETFWDWAGTMVEEFTPINVQGKNAQERIESVGASLNPLVKAPLEVGTGRDFYRHRDIVPDTMKKASPTEQYTDRTADIFKNWANAMPDVSPDFMQSPLMLENMTRNLTAGLFTQFIARKPIEGRTRFENNPLMQRFQGLPYTDSSEFDQQMEEYERDGADAQLARYRNARKVLDENKGAELNVLAQKLIKAHGPDEKLLRRMVDLWTAEKQGITTEERRILALPVAQRAQFLQKEFAGKSPEEKAALIRNYAIKRILTEAVAEQMGTVSE